MTLRVSPATLVKNAEDSGRPGVVACAPWWERVPLSSVAQVANGAPFDSRFFNVQGRGMPLIRIRDVGTARGTTWYEGPWQPSDVVEPGTLLVGMDGDFRSALWRGPPALLNQRVCRVDVTDADYDKRFLTLALQGYLDLIWGATSATTVKHLSSKSIAEIPLPRPPLLEQRRIVAILEEHLTSLDAAESALTSAGRRSASRMAKVLSQSRTGELVPLPGVAAIQGGIQKQQKRSPRHNAYPFLRVANVTSHGLDLAEVHLIELFGDELDRLRLREGDLLVVEGNGSPAQIGRAALWDGSIVDCVHQNHLIRIRADRTQIVPEYLEVIWNSPENRRILTDVSSSSSGLHTLSVSKLERLLLPVPSVTEQLVIVETVERHRAAQRRLDVSLQVASARVRALRRSLLAAAFSGRLTGRASDSDVIETIADQEAS